MPLGIFLGIFIGLGLSPFTVILFKLRDSKLLRAMDGAPRNIAICSKCFAANVVRVDRSENPCPNCYAASLHSQLEWFEGQLKKVSPDQKELAELREFKRLHDAMRASEAPR